MLSIFSLLTCRTTELHWEQTQVRQAGRNRQLFLLNRAELTLRIELLLFMTSWLAKMSNQLSDVGIITIPLMGPHGLTFAWWGCYSLCQRHKLTKFAHSFLFCSCVYFCRYGPFNYISFHNPPDNSPLSHSVLPVLPLPYWSFQLYISLWKSLSALI